MQTANANRLRELRTGRELELYDLAPIVRRSPAQISRYETGESEIPVSIAKLLATYYGVTLDYLLGVDLDKEAA